MNLKIPILLVLLAFTLCSCSHSTTTTNSPGGNGNNNGSTVDSSYGSATMILDGKTHISCSNNFFLYDSSKHRLHIQLIGTPPLFIDMSLEMDNLTSGIYNYPSDTAILTALFTNTSEGFFIPAPNCPSIQLTVSKVDLARHTLSAMLSIHFSDTVLHVRTVDSLMLTNVGLAIVPNGHPSSFHFTKASDTIPNGDPYTLLVNYTPSVQVEMDYYSGMVTIGDTAQEFSFRFNPIPGFVGQFPFHDVVTDLTYYWSALDQLGRQIDTSWNQNDGTLTITNYDAGTRQLSGTFIGQMQDEGRTKLDSISGSFQNILLND